MPNPIKEFETAKKKLMDSVRTGKIDMDTFNKKFVILWKNLYESDAKDCKLPKSIKNMYNGRCESSESESESESSESSESESESEDEKPKAKRKVNKKPKKSKKTVKKD